MTLTAPLCQTPSCSGTTRWGWDLVSVWVGDAERQGGTSVGGKEWRILWAADAEGQGLCRVLARVKRLGVAIDYEPVHTPLYGEPPLLWGPHA